MFTRVLAAAAILIAAAALLLAAWPQLFGLEKAPFVAQVVSMRGLAIAVALVGVVVLTLVALVSVPARRFAASIAIVLLGFAAVNTAVLSTRGFGNTSFESRDSNELTVLSWNTLGDSPEAVTVAQLAIDVEADIIALPETTEAMGDSIAALLGDSARPMQSFTIAFDEISKARSTTLLVAASLGAYSIDRDSPNTQVLPSVVATPDDGTGPKIVSVHAVAPIAGQMENWRTDLNWLSEQCVGDNVIMAGDFNSTVDHYSGLATAEGAALGECLDAGVESDNGAVGTWPTSWSPFLGAPIDHVMYTDNWRVSGMRVIESHDKHGSDHRPIVVQLSPSG